MSLGCSATNCASSCRRSCAGAEERSAWASVGSCRLGCTNAPSSQTGRPLRVSHSALGGQRPKGIYGRRSLNHKNPPFSIGATNLTTGDYRGSGLVQRNVMEYRARLFHLDVGSPDRLAPLLCLIGDELSKVGGRAH